MSARFLILALWPLALTGCAHEWPREARGGMAERSISDNPSLQAYAEQVEFLKLAPGELSPSDIAVASDDLLRARREWAGGLKADAEESLLSASVRLGGVPFAKTAEPVCLRQPCTGE